MIDFDDYLPEEKPLIDKYLQCIRQYNLKELAPVISKIPSDIIEHVLYVIAAENGTPEDEAILKYLLNKKKDSGKALEIICHEDYRVFRMAIEHGHIKITEFLLTLIPREEHSRMINNHMIRYSFLQAVRKGYFEMIRQLLENNESFPDELLNHLFKYAITYKSLAIFNLLLTRYGNVYEKKALDFLNDAIEDSNSSAFNSLCSRYNNVFQKNILRLISTAVKNQSSLLQGLLDEFVKSGPRVDKFSPNFAILRTNVSISINLFKLHCLIFNILQIVRTHEAVKKLMCAILAKIQEENMEIEDAQGLEIGVIAALFPEHSQQHIEMCQYSNEIYNFISSYYRKGRLSKEQMTYNYWFKEVPDMCWNDPDMIKDVLPFASEPDWQKYFKFIFANEDLNEPLKVYLDAMHPKERYSGEFKPLENLLFFAPRRTQYYYVALFLAACGCKKEFEYLCNQIPEEEKANLVQWVKKELVNYPKGSVLGQKQLVLNELNDVAALMNKQGMSENEHRLASEQVTSPSFSIFKQGKSDKSDLIPGACRP